MEDFIYKGRLEGLEIAYAFGVTTDLVNTAVLRHDCDPVAAHILGRGLTAGVLQAALMGGKEQLNIRWQYQGALRTMLVDISANGEARGLVSPAQLSDTSDDKDQLFGDACQVSVVKSIDGKVVSSGTTESIFQGPVKDFTYYCSTSEQVETGMKVMIGFSHHIERPVDVCQGILLSALPDCNLEKFDVLRERLSSPSVVELLSQSNESDSHLENIINALLGTDIVKPRIVMDRGPTPVFKCSCSREKMAAVIRSVPINDRMEMVKAGDDIHIRCQFCNERYTLTIPECIRAWNDKPIDSDWEPDPQTDG